MASKYSGIKPVAGICVLAAGLVFVLPFNKPTLQETALQPESRNVERIVEEGSPDATAAGDRVDDIGNVAKQAKGVPGDVSTDYLGKFASLSIDTRTESTDFGSAGQARRMDDPYPFLLGLAESGDPAAAYLLLDFLRDCSSSFRTEDELEAAIVGLYETRRIPSRTGDIEVSGEFDPRGVEANLRETFARCRSVPDVAIKDSMKWLKHAAYQGLPIAMQKYADSMRRTEPDEAVRMYAELWELGSAKAADSLAKMYQKGWAGQAPDPVLAAAYGFISTESLLAYIRDPATRFDEQSLDSTSQMIRGVQKKYLTSISPREFDAAFEEARRLLEANNRCCTY